MPRVILYTTSPCHACSMVKSFLQGWRVAYQEKDLTRDPLSRAALIAALNRSDTPVIEIGNRVVVGFDLNRITELIQASGV